MVAPATLTSPPKPVPSMVALTAHAPTSLPKVISHCPVPRSVDVGVPALLLELVIVQSDATTAQLFCPCRSKTWP